MKKLFTLLAFVIITVHLSAQPLTGIKSIPGDYATIQAAITALNTNGVGTGGVTFNVASGHTETLANMTAGTITATGTASNPVIFQKSGAGANPVVTAAVISTATAYDAVIVLAGSDYFTFNGIDIAENAANTTNRTDWGYALVKSSVTDGAQNNTIRNCTITLSKLNTSSVGIYAGNHLSNSITSLTITSIAGANSGNKFFLNTISNVYVGISLNGFNALTPFDLYDQGNEIGHGGANNITNFGGGTLTTYGIYTIYQNNLKVNNNVINGGTASTSTVYGIMVSSATNANTDINSNTITVTSGATTSGLYGITCAAGGTGTNNTTNINNNTVTNCSYPTTTSGLFYAINPTGGAFTLNCNNNIITNNTIGAVGVTATGTWTGIYSFGLNSTVGSTWNINNNTITGNSRIQSTIGSGTNYGIYNSSSGLTLNVSGNTIENFTAASNGITALIYILNSALLKNIFNNTLGAVLNSNGTVYGIWVTSGSQQVYQNRIYNLNSVGASSTISGIMIGSVTDAYVYNNRISELFTPAATGVTSISGINAAGGTNIGLYYNSIYLNATSTGATFGTAGIHFSSSTPVVDMRNNVVVNNSTPGATGFTVGLRRTVTTFTAYNALSNNNLWFCGTPGASRLIYHDGTNMDQTIAAFKGRVAPRESNSVSELPPFVNVATSPFNLKMQTTVATQVESGGIRITTPIAITNDFENDIRFGETAYTGTGISPDMGADEFNGIFLDLNGPSIVYNALTNTSATTQRTLIATITDISGVPTSGAGLPRLYWRINTGSWQSSIATSLGGGQYQFQFGGGVVLGNIVEYYIAAQDNYSTPNISCSPSTGAAGLTANPPTAATPPTTPSSYTIIGTICGTFNVGTGQTYTTLTAAINDFNNKEMTCAVTFVLTDADYSTAETFPIVINPNTGSSATNTLTIKVGSGVTTSISGSVANGAILRTLNSNTIIDGSNITNGTTRNLTISNTSATTPQVINIMSNGTSAITNVTLKNCNIINGVNTSTPVVVSDLAGTAGTFSNITIQNNTVQKAYIGIYVLANAVAGNGAGTLITQNDLTTTGANSVRYVGIYVQGTDGAVISNNIIGNFDGTTGENDRGIWLATGTVNTQVNANTIFGLKYLGTAGYGGYGIAVSTGTVNANITLSNNVIYDITGDGYGSAFGDNPFGLYLFSTQTGIKVYHNSINLFGNTLNYSGAFSGGIALGTGTTADIRNNNIVNNLGLFATTGSGSSGIILQTAISQIETSNYNDIWVNPTGSGVKNIALVSATPYTTLTAWQIASLQDANSLNINPSFISNTNLTPTATGLDNSGTYLTAVTKDFNNVNRTNPPDMGAIEFGTNPAVTTLAASGITSSAANLNGSINANTLIVNTFFDYGLTTSYGTSVAATPASVTGTTTTAISTPLTGLAASTTYNFRARGVTAGGVHVYGNNFTFTTAGPPPSVVTSAASSITGAGATLNGTVNANGASTTVTFDYGLTTSYGLSATAAQSPVSGTTVTPVSAAITGLAPNTLYNFRAKGVSINGTTNGSNMTFTTAVIPATVTTLAANNILTTSATLNGTVNANNASTVVTFAWGLSPTTLTNIATATPSPVTGTTATAVTANLTGLTINTTYYFQVIGTNAAGAANGTVLSFLTGCPQPAAAGTISGPTGVCVNTTGHVYTVPAIANATGYAWTLPAGGTITAGANTNSITVSYSAAATSGNVSVYGTSSCSNGTASNLAVTLNPRPVPTIAGPAAPCQGVTGNVYTTQSGMTGYTWTVSAGGTITAGATTNAITVTWTTAGAKTVTVSYTNASGCAATTPGSYAVNVLTGTAPTITGPAAMCANSGYYTYSTETGMTNYQWNISAGGTIVSGAGTSSVVVSWIAPGNQTLSVNYNGTNGCAAVTPASKPVTVNGEPGNAGNITGTATACAGSNNATYSVPTVTNATAYAWELPAGASVIAGQYTNSITVEFAPNAVSGVITVSGNNLCGNGGSSSPFNVTINPIPAAAGAITGTNSVCAGSNAVSYSVPAIANATSYTWTLPTGASIASGANTNNITVNFAATAVTGNISVYGTNTCGNGAASANYAVTVKPKPVTPVITLTDAILLSSSATTGNQWYLNGAPITGATSATYTAVANGAYYCIVTVNGCSSSPSNTINVIAVGIEQLQNNGISIYPVPNDGRFTIVLPSDITGQTIISIYNHLGIKIYESTENAGSMGLEKTIDIRPVASGVYTVLVMNSDRRIVRKILISK